jgi:hypothetical protein
MFGTEAVSSGLSLHCAAEPAARRAKSVIAFHAIELIEVLLIMAFPTDAAHSAAEQ